MVQTTTNTSHQDLYKTREYPTVKEDTAVDAKRICVKQHRTVLKLSSQRNKVLSKRLVTTSTAKIWRSHSRKSRRLAAQCFLTQRVS